MAQSFDVRRFTGELGTPFSLQVGAADRYFDLITGSFEVQQVIQANTTDTCKFRIRGQQPAWGEECYVILPGGDVLFGGFIVKAEMDEYLRAGTRQERVWICEAHDWSRLMVDRLVTMAYVDKPADEIFLELMHEYAPWATVDVIGPDVTVVDSIGWVDAPLTGALDELAAYAGWQWNLDYYKRVSFIPETDLPPAPFGLVPGGAFTNLKRETDFRGVKNRVFIRGGLEVSTSTVTQTFTYTTGGPREWNLTYRPREVNVTLTRSGTPTAQDVGQDGVDDQASFDFMANYAGAFIKASDQTALVNNDTITVVYKYDLPVLTQADDTDSQDELSARLGGDGVAEAVVVDTNITTTAAGLARAEAELRKLANPRETVTFKTHELGWTPGQRLPVALTDGRGIDSTFLTQEVIYRRDAGTWDIEVKAGGARYGIGDLLYDMRKTVRDAARAEQTVTNKATAQAGTVTIADAVTMDDNAYAAAQVGTAVVGFSEVA